MAGLGWGGHVRIMLERVISLSLWEIADSFLSIANDNF